MSIVVSDYRVMEQLRDGSWQEEPVYLVSGNDAIVFVPQYLDDPESVVEAVREALEDLTIERDMEEAVREALKHLMIKRDME